MNWTTLYITGKADFKEEVWKKLENSKLDIMPGYLENSSGRGFYDLYWVNESITTRDIKEVIGSKLVWKYRLRLYKDLEEFLALGKETPKNAFTSEEQEMLEAMRKSA